MALRSRHSFRRGLRLRQRGFSLIEAMISMGILTVGLLGLMATQIAAVRMDGQGMKISQASSIAQAVANYLLVARWDSPLLTDIEPANNADPNDSDLAFSSPAPAVQADHQLTFNGASATFAVSAHDNKEFPIFSLEDSLDYNGDGQPDFEVRWNVTNCFWNVNTQPWTKTCVGIDDGNANAKHVSVIVRWQVSEKWFELTQQVEVRNPNRGGI